MTTQTTTVENITPSRNLSLKDVIWMLGVFGATVGAGTLFLPVEIGTRGPLVFFMLLILAFPLSMVPHVMIGRVFMRDHQTADRTLPMFGSYFGAKGRQAIKIYFCIAHFPVTLVYGISLVNALDNVINKRLHLAALNRGVLAFVVIGLLFLILSKGRDKVVSTLSALALPFAITVLAIAAYHIPGWDPASFVRTLKETSNASAGETIKNLWLTLPLITFAFCSTPLISPLASYYREKGNGGEKKAVLVIRLAYGLIFFSIIFFVLSCILSIPRETFVYAKEHNLDVLSVMQSAGGSSVIFYLAPLIAILGMTKSFLGISLSVAETFTTLTAEAMGAKDERRLRKAKALAFLIMFVVSFIVVYINPDVITLIETVCGPLIAIFLFLIPVYLIYTRESLRQLRGFTALTILTGGLLTVSALLYGMF